MVEILWMMTGNAAISANNIAKNAFEMIISLAQRENKDLSRR